MKLFAHLPASSKTRLPIKARSLGIRCESLLDINFAGFSLAKLQQEQISHLRAVMKKIYNFPMKSELPKFILPVKISWFIFSSVYGVEMNNFQRSGQDHFLVLRAHSCSMGSNVSLFAG